MFQRIPVSKRSQIKLQCFLFFNTNFHPMQGPEAIYGEELLNDLRNMKLRREKNEVSIMKIVKTANE